jgi:hypothetical protein
MEQNIVEVLGEIECTEGLSSKLLNLLLNDPSNMGT